MVSRITLFSILLLTSSIPVTAMAEILSLNDLLKHVLDNHPAVKATRHEIKRLELTRAETESLYDGSLYSDVSYDKSRYNDDRPYSDSDQSLNSSLGFNKRFREFGGRLRINYFIDKNRNTYSSAFLAANTDDNYYSSLSLDLSIPLLKNFGGLLDRSRTESIDFDIESRQLLEDEDIEQLLTITSHDYLDWVVANKSVIITKQFLTDTLALEQSSQPVNERIKTQINWIVSEAKKNHSLTQSVLNATSRQLAEYIDLGNHTPGSQGFASPPAPLPAALSPESIALSSLRILKIYSIKDKKNDHAIKTRMNATRPDLNFTIHSRVRGDGEHFTSSQDDDHTYTRAGLRLDFPIGNTGALAALDRSKLQKVADYDEKQAQQLKLSATIKSLFSQILEMQQTLRIASQTRSFSGQAHKHEMAAFVAGKTDISVLTNTLRRSIQLKLDIINNEALYQHLRIEYLSAIDKLWDGKSINDNI